MRRIFSVFFFCITTEVIKKKKKKQPLTFCGEPQIITGDYRIRICSVVLEISRNGKKKLNYLNTIINISVAFISRTFVFVLNRILISVFEEKIKTKKRVGKRITYGSTIIVQNVKHEQNACHKTRTKIMNKLRVFCRVKTLLL